MKYKLLRLSLLGILAMFAGLWGNSIWAADKWVKTAPSDLISGDVVAIVDQTTVAAMSNDKGASSAPLAVAVTLTTDKSEISSDVDENLQWVVTVTEDGYQFNVADTKNYLYCTNTNNGVRVGTNSDNVFTIVQGGDNNANFLCNTATTRYVGVYSGQDWRCYTSINANIKATVTTFYKQVPDPSDTRTATTVNAGRDQTGTVGSSMNLPVAVVKDAAGAIIEGAAVTWSCSNEQVAKIDGSVLNLLAVGEATITATFAGDDNYKGSKGSFKVTVTNAPYTSIAAMLADITSTKTTANYKFENLLVTYVQGSNTYVSDGTNGFLFYGSDLGLNVGEKITGSVTGQLYTYNGLPEMALSADGINVQVTSTDNEVAWPAIAPADLQNYINIPVTIENAVFVETGSGKNLTFKVGDEEFAVYNNWSIPVGGLKADATYTLTGVGSVYSKGETTTYQLYLVTFEATGEQPVDTRLDVTLSFPQESYEAILGEDFEEPVLTVDPAEYDGMISYKSSDASVATVSYEGLVTLVGPGTVIITAEAMASQTYKEAEASYTLIVNERETPPEPEELANPYSYTFEKKVFDAKSQTMTLNAANWALNVTCVDADGYFGYDSNKDNNKGQQFGSGSKPATAITLSTSDIPGTITKIVVNTSGANNIDATFSVSVGEATFQYAGEATTSVALTNAATDYEFTGSASGAITISWANNSSKAIYVKSIYVEYTTEQPVEPAGWRDIKADLTQLQALATESDVYIKVAEDGTISQADNAEEAAATLKGKWHSTNYGWSNFTASVPVEGCVKITYATHDYGNDIIVTNSEGEEVAKLNTTGAKWSSNHDNVVVAYYRTNAPTTLHFSNANYNPYFAVEAIAEADLPAEVTEYTVTFDAANSGAEGVAPAEITAEIGSKIVIPANTTLYIEGKTLTGWIIVGTPTETVLKPGDEITVSEDISLIPKFTDNTVAFADRTEETTLVWQFGEGNGVGTLNAQGKSTILVTQATIGENVIDVKMDIDATNGKINNVGRGDEWAQCNDNTVLTIPAYKGMNVTFRSYGDATGTTIGGIEAENKSATYNGSSETLDIVAKGMGYISNVTAVYPVPTQDVAGFVDIKADLTNQNLLTDEEKAGIADESNKNPTLNIGISVDAEGNVTRVDKDAANANAVINAKWHSNEHGWSNFSATVPVEGTVKITFGTCAWGGDVTVKNAEGETVATMNTNTGACYHQDKENNIVSCYYKQDVATTLTISGGAYVPYFAVEKVDPKDVPSDVKLIFDVANSGAEGVGPADEIVGIGKQYTLPKNFTLYKEGYTLTGWAAEGAVYAPGETITAPDAESLTFTPVFSENEVSLADRDEAVTVKWNFRRDAGAPTVGWENQDGLVWVAQATVAGKTIDVALPFSTAPGKFANGNWTDWAQVNNGTTFHVPSCKGATISMEAYGDITTTTIDGQSDYTQGKTISYTVAGAAESVDVVIGDGSYYRYIQVVLPKAEQQQGGGESFDHVAGTINWPIGDELQPVISEDIAGAISSASVSVGNELTINTAKYFDTEMMHYTPVNSNAGNVEGVMIEYRVKPTAGVTFQPTQIDYAAVKVGTDNATYSWSYTVDGEESTITQIDPKPDLLRNNGANSVENGGTAKLMHTETFEGVGECNEFTFRFYISACANNKNICIGNVTISGIVNGEAVSVNMYDLTAVASPEEGGSINIYPVSEQYEEGSEVTLTATENFGYDFVNWTNAAGDEVSTEAKFKYTVNSNETLTANFVAVNTYELALTIDGTNDYMVTINPAPTMVDGKMMYEEGQAVQLTANQYEGLVTFTNWSDGDTGSSKLVSMTADVELTAMYAQADIIAGWDFYKRGNDGRKADFAAQDNDGDALTLVETATGNTSGWLDKSHEADGGYEGLMGAAVNWKQGTTEGDVGNWHWQTKVNAEAFTDINVQFQMVFNYNAYPTYNVEYSLDGEQWTNAGSITMARREIAQFKGQLPAEANNQTELYIRMIADKTSELNTDVPSKNDGNSLGMFFITGTPKLVDDGVAPVLVSTVPADGATGASATGKIVLTFDERVKLADDAVAYINNTAINSEMQNPTSGIVNGKTITFAYKGLEYSTEYSFILPANSVADLTDNFITEPIRLTFTIMTRPSIDKKLYDYVVENVDDLMAAISAAEARADKNVRYRIFIKDGEYTIPVKENSLVAKAEGYEVPECITFIRSGNISLIGESRDGVIITNGIDKTDLFNGTYGKTSKYDGIGNSDVFQISGSDYYFQDLTIESGMDDATGRDLAVQDKATRTIYKNTGLRGFQDTWTSNNDNGLYYFEGGYVRGRTDYMCGKGDAFFNGVELRQVAGGYAAVPSKSIKYGFVYKDCTINGEPAKVNYATGETRTAAQADGNYTLGRPWGSGTPIALYIDTKMNVVPSAIGWNEMSGGWPKRFAEYNSMTSTGSQIDLSGRKKTFGDGHENNPILTAEEALEAGDLHNMFGEWDPTLATEQAPIPTNVKVNKDTKVLSWDNSNYALLFAIVKDGKVIDFTIENSYTVDDATASYSVRAANEMGGLSEASATAAITTAISEVTNGEQAVPETIYNLNGVRVEKAQKGLYIVNGKKVMVK